jgi:phenylpyruvate tautomerase PptA (4-oxalocrotonate tautomerase family)
MPTYVCTTATNRLSVDQKKAVIKLLTTVHSEETDTPRLVVQVIFHELPVGQHFINEIPVSRDQIWIRADIRAGRTDEQRTKMITRIVNLASSATNIDASYFWVYICDIPKMAEFGSVMPNPGGEAAWVTALPDSVKERYQFYATSKI